MFDQPTDLDEVVEQEGAQGPNPVLTMNDCEDDEVEVIREEAAD